MRNFLLLFGMFVFANSNAQRTCINYSSPVSKVIKNYASRDTGFNEIITIPVVVHVVYNTAIQNISDEQINSQISSLNKDFRLQNENEASIPAPFKQFAADVKIQFVLAKVDPLGRPTTGIIRKSTTKTSFSPDDAVKFSGAGGSDVWNPNKYLNFWVCNLGGNNLGYASVPGSSPDRDGVVIAYNVFGTVGTLRAPFDKGRTATHEVGHWMGLKHIWGDTNCGTDDVDDTPRQKSFHYGIPVFPQLSDCSENGNGDMFMNYMDLTDDACMSMFTNGQKRKMRSVFAAGGYRNEMLNSTALAQTTEAAPLPSTVEVATQEESFAISIYPNPVSNILNIEFKNSEKIENIPAHIYNQLGVQVYKGILNNSKNTINISNLNPGFYVLRIGKNKAFKIVKN